MTNFGAVRKALKADRAAEARRLRAAGWPLRRIAEHLGVSHPTVLEDLREAKGA